jgi:hypothetical protein
MPVIDDLFTALGTGRRSSRDLQDALGVSQATVSRLLTEAGERAARIAMLQRFGEQIGNSDMHLGNLSLAPEGDRFRLLPVYDMLPMALAPRHGELPSVLPARPAPDGLPPAITAALREYRRRLRSDERVTTKFRELTAE